MLDELSTVLQLRVIFLIVFSKIDDEVYGTAEEIVKLFIVPSCKVQ
jgi:hypothetical protein